MKLKTSRLRKAQDQIKRIVNKTALLSLQKDCSQAFNKKQELSTSGTISQVRDARTELHDRLNDLQRRKKLLEAREARFKKQHKETHKRVEDQKRSLEKIVSDLSDKNVQILLD
jgi:predicted  nucleic acid-binding Zn-ribbon protein